LVRNFGSALRLRNDLYCVEWGVKLYSLTHFGSAPCTKKDNPFIIIIIIIIIIIKAIYITQDC